MTAYRRCDDCIDEATCTLRRVLLAVRDATADILENRTLMEALASPAPKKSKRRSAGGVAPTRATVPCTTPQGHIMFDTAQEPFVELIEANIRKVGINPRDIKYIVVNHGHTDHFGGAKRLQEFTGARVVATPQDWKMIEDTAGRPNNRDNGKPTDVPKRDMEVNEGDHLDLGDQHLIIHTAQATRRAICSSKASFCVTARRPIAASGAAAGAARRALPAPSKG